MPKRTIKINVSTVVLLVIVMTGGFVHAAQPLASGQAPVSPTTGGVGNFVQNSVTDNLLFGPFGPTVTAGRYAYDYFRPNSGGGAGNSGERFFSDMWNGFLAVLGKALGFVLYAIGYLIGYISGIIFTFAGIFLSYALKLNGSLLKSPTVQIGWTITRDLANLGFVLAIIFIAFATMLRLNRYGMKQNLWRLVVVALLVNFSLSIAGLFIDASGLLTNFFVAQVIPPTSSLSGINDNGMQFSTSLANAFGLQKLLNIDDLNLKNYGGITEFGTTMITGMANLFFIVMFTIMGAVTMMATAALVYVRYIYLTILLILMPLAWIGWVFPGSELSRANSKWWSKFMEWIIWLPVSTFFIYLSILIVTNQASDANSLNYIARSIQTAPQGNALDSVLSFVTNSFETFGRMLAILGLMAGGLIAASKISDSSAQSIVGFAGQAQGWLTDRVSKAAVYGPRRAWQGLLRSGSRSAQTDEKTGEPVKGTERAPFGQRLATGLSRLGLSGAASTLSDFMASGSKEVKSYQEKYLRNLNDDALLSYSELGGPVAIAAKAAELARRDKLGSVSPSKLNTYIDAVRKMGMEKEFLANRPDLALQFGKKVSDVVKRSSNVNDISKEALTNEEVLASLSATQFKSLGMNASEDKKDVARSGISAAVRRYADLRASGGTLTAEQQEREKKLQFAQRLVNTPSWTVKEIEPIVTLKPATSPTKEELITLYPPGEPITLYPPTTPTPTARQEEPITLYPSKGPTIVTGGVVPPASAMPPKSDLERIIAQTSPVPPPSATKIEQRSAFEQAINQPEEIKLKQETTTTQRTESPIKFSEPSMPQPRPAQPTKPATTPKPSPVTDYDKKLADIGWKVESREDDLRHVRDVNQPPSVIKSAEENLKRAQQELARFERQQGQQVQPAAPVTAAPVQKITPSPAPTQTPTPIPTPVIRTTPPTPPMPAQPLPVVRPLPSINPPNEPRTIPPGPQSSPVIPPNPPASGTITRENPNRGPQQGPSSSQQAASQPTPKPNNPSVSKEAA